MNLLYSIPVVIDINVLYYQIIKAWTTLFKNRKHNEVQVLDIKYFILNYIWFIIFILYLFKILIEILYFIY